MPTFTVVSEIGLNFNGFLTSAIELLDISKECGVSTAKFQKRTPELSTPRSEWDKLRVPPWGGEPIRYIEYRQGIELSVDNYKVIDAHCKEIGLSWTVSIWDTQALEDMKPFDVPYWKIPSAHATNHALLDAVVATGKPIMLSCGMSTELEIDESVGIIKYGNSPSLLHCNSSYPCDDGELNLSLIPKMQDRYGLPVGFSNHSRSPFPAIEAMAMGATVVEAHLTRDRSLAGSDHATSLEPAGMALVVREARRLEKAWGDGERRVWPSEFETRKRLRGV